MKIDLRASHPGQPNGEQRRRPDGQRLEYDESAAIDQLLGMTPATPHAQKSMFESTTLKKIFELTLRKSW